jgi:hypothetical protein
MTVFCKETLRSWTVLAMCLPRVSTKDIQWQDATIPAGTTFIMVGQKPSPFSSKAQHLSASLPRDTSD